MISKLVLKLFPLPLLIFPCLTFSACAGTYKQSLNFDPREPLRIAVPPFAYVDQSGNVVQNIDSSLAVDKVPLISSELKETPPEYVRRIVFAGLSKSGLDLIPPAVVEAGLMHHGLNIGKLPDIKKIHQQDPKILCEILSCDAIMLGRVTKWNRRYYGIQSVNTVGIELKLFNAKTGQEIFSAIAEDSDNRGLSKGPTGFSSIVIEPVRGLDSSIIIDLAQNMVDKMLKSLAVSNKPEFLNTAPPSIYASSHDSRSGVITQGRPLTVLMYGSPKSTAYFSIGNFVENIPMSEKSNGHYIGEYYPLPTDRFKNQFITVHIADSNGRVTKQKVGISDVTLN